MKKIALYVRVSTSDQTVENQKIRLIDYAEKSGQNYDIFEEIVSTRKTRPVKQALLSRLRNNEYAAVVVYKLDRWARSSTELILDTKELLDKGIGFISISDYRRQQAFHPALRSAYGIPLFRSCRNHARRRRGSKRRSPSEPSRC